MISVRSMQEALVNFTIWGAGHIGVRPIENAELHDFVEALQASGFIGGDLSDAWLEKDAYELILALDNSKARRTRSNSALIGILEDLDIIVCDADGVWSWA